MNLKHVLRSFLVAALSGSAIVAVGSPPAVAAGAACRRTFSSGPIDKIVESPLSQFSAITVPDDGLVVADVDVSVDIHHADTQDLRIIMSSAGGGKSRGLQTLFFHDGHAGGDNLLGTTFDDEATVPISSGEAPFTGRFKPANPLSVFDGATGGFYQLNVLDDVAGNSGTWDDWSLTLTYASCDFDADGVEDHVDQCRSEPAHTLTGCPLASRRLAASYRHGKFRGALSSPVSGCTSRRSVSVFRTRPGPDRRVGTATTRTDGSWRLARPKKRGRYYAKASRVAVPDRAECPAVTSTTFRVR